MKVMGILNVTPDSFHEATRTPEIDAALDRALRMTSEGADIIDVGAESTRPGATRVSASEEWGRLKDILPQLVQSGMTVSVDTINASTALRALDVGVSIINDVSGGIHDPVMNEVMADADAQYVIQHWRGFPSDPNLDTRYDSVDQVLAETLDQVERAENVGVSSERIIIDPGLGFALTSEDSWRVVDALGSWVKTGYPVLVGASRKRFIRTRFEALEGTLRVTRIAADAGVWAVRVHDVAANVEVA